MSFWAVAGSHRKLSSIRREIMPSSTGNIDMVSNLTEVPIAPTVGVVLHVWLLSKENIGGYRPIRRV